MVFVALDELLLPAFKKLPSSSLNNPRKWESCAKLLETITESLESAKTPLTGIYSVFFLYLEFKLFNASTH